MTETQRDAVFAGIPYILDGITCTKVLSDQYVPDPTLPSVTIKYLSDSIRVRWKGQEIRSFREHRTDDFDCTEGLIEKATIGLTVSSLSYADTLNMAADMLVQLYRDRLGLDWYDYRVKFVDTLNAPIESTYRLEQDRALVYRAHVDISIEYEVSWPVTAAAIRKVGADIQVGNIATNDLAHIYELMYAPGLWGMDLHLASDRCWFSLDAILEKPNRLKTALFDVYLVETTDYKHSSCEMGLTLE